MSKIVNIASVRKAVATKLQDENYSFDAVKCVENIETIMEGFYSLDAYQKGQAYQANAEILIEVLKLVFWEDFKSGDEE